MNMLYTRKKILLSTLLISILGFMPLLSASVFAQGDSLSSKRLLAGDLMLDIEGNGSQILLDGILLDAEEGVYSSVVTKYGADYVIHGELKLTVEAPECTIDSWAISNCSPCTSGIQVCEVALKDGEVCKGGEPKPSEVRACSVGDSEEDENTTNQSNNDDTTSNSADPNDGADSPDEDADEETAEDGEEDPDHDEETGEQLALGEEEPEENMAEELLETDPDEQEVSCAVPRKIAPLFQDTQDHWAKDFVETMRLLGIVHGKKDGVYDPDAKLTRAELTKIVLNAFCISVEGFGKNSPFPDVTPTDWHAPFVDKAKIMKIVQGYQDSKFHPNQSVTRAEAVKMVMAVEEINAELDDGQNFSDVAGDQWFGSIIEKAAALKIIQGYDDNSFRPNSPITRAEMAKVVVKVLELLGKTNDLSL